MILLPPVCRHQQHPGLLGNLQPLTPTCPTRTRPSLDKQYSLRHVVPAAVTSTGSSSAGVEFQRRGQVSSSLWQRRPPSANVYLKSYVGILILFHFNPFSLVLARLLLARLKCLSVTLRRLPREKTPLWDKVASWCMCVCVRACAQRVQEKYVGGASLLIIVWTQNISPTARNNITVNSNTRRPLFLFYIQSLCLSSISSELSLCSIHALTFPLLKALVTL